MSKHANLANLFDEAIALYQRGLLEQARSNCRKILRKSPNQPDVLHFLGVIEARNKRFDAAVELFRRALAFDPQNAIAHSNYGNVLRELGRHEDALASFDRALAIAPDCVDAYVNRGNALLELRKYEAALASHDLALNFDPDNATAWMNRGIALCELKQHKEAIASFDRALAIAPQFAEALYNRGRALREVGRHQDAIASYDLALALRPDYAAAMYNRGNALLDLKRHEDAIASFDRALAVDPRHANALYGSGNALSNLGRHADAVESYTRALAIKPDHADALYRRSNAYIPQERYEEAALDLERLLRLQADYDYAWGALLHARMHCCNWQDFEEMTAKCEADVRAGRRTIEPFAFQAICRSPRDAYCCSRIYVDDRYPAAAAPLWQEEKYDAGKIRIGYVSGEFREHAISRLMIELFELHDQERFELFAFDNGWDDGSDIRKRINDAFDEIVDITRLTDHEAATVIKEKRIDILVNLNGHFGYHRQGVFSCRPCPVQVNYLGFSGTIGADYIDYILADQWIIPPAHQAHYSEKVVYLPDVYQVSDSTRAIADHVPSRTDAGLPENGFVFCCFHNNFKITPVIFDVWMRLLNKIDNSVLWLSRANAASKRNLRFEAEKRGVSSDRLIFADRADNTADHLARHRLADLFLDTWPFNAGTTASDALWAGLPVLTCSGETYCGRMAGSLLKAVGLPELITGSVEAYESLAFKCAADQAFLSGLRAKLTRNRNTSPLFDTERFRRHIEMAYLTMWERARHGEAPTGFAVNARP